MSFSRLLLDVDPHLASTLRGVDHETQFPVLHVVKRKWNSFLFSAVTYAIFEKRIVHNLIQMIPDLANIPLISWFFSKELSSVAPGSLAVVASSRRFLEQTPEEPVAYLDADKVMQFPKENQKRSYEDAMIEYTKLKELYVAQERARLLTELVHLVQWCWEERTLSVVCYYSPEELTGIEEAIEAAMEESEKGLLSVVTSQSKRELVVGRSTQEGGFNRGFTTLNCRLLNEAKQPKDTTEPEQPPQDKLELVSDKDTKVASPDSASLFNFSNPVVVPPGTEEQKSPEVDEDSPDDYLTTIFENMEPYIDTYDVYKQLTRAGFTPAQSDEVINLLIVQVNSKLLKLSTKYSQEYELENERYLFESAQQELNVDVTRNRENHINDNINQINVLERDFGTIRDELNNHFIQMKNDIQVAINDQKSENTLMSKNIMLRIKETNHKITTDFTMAMRSEIESLRWHLSRWGLIAIMVSVFSACASFYVYRIRSFRKAAEKNEFVPLVIYEPSEYDEDDFHADLDPSIL
ncbi:hypothetical protein C7M61_003385 [Candidozyma pseudohaemuli]|uniref:Uncharacterized protein n=1 Tax=Candidozyma pseudohaemuli TaxID=418784 RepID=A0A2P7YNY7_9ASCO|nr:hypothetical protein C7M61_003385 [[Candida] pseudohaemulonii]PSK37678.1 hypothetical protein C7M61_003385 [[Candida] pseudohaemulonii]